MSDGQTLTPGPPLDNAAISGLKASLNGGVALPGDEGYTQATALYNAMIDKRPGAVVRCQDKDDVITAVNFAREKGIHLSVRGGGHNVAGKALVDEGLVIDLTPMNEVRVDPGNRVAYVQGGATWRDVDQATHAHGLATPGGLVSSTGVGGLTLGGGITWLMRKYGMSCDNLLRAELVTATGDVVYTSDTENPDLYWGLRGGGGNFGVVTGFEFRLHPVETVLGGMILHPFDRAKEALEFYREFNRTAPDELTTFATMMTTPEGDKVVAYIVSYAGDPDRGQDVIKPLLEWGPPIMTQVGPMPYPQLQQMLDESFPPGLRNYWRSSLLNTLPNDVFDGMIAHFEKVDSPLTALLLEQFGGAMARVSPDATAFPHRNAAYNFVVLARWTDPAEDDRHIAWARKVSETAEPYSTGGAYVNYLSDEGRDPVRSAYGSETYARLAELKSKWDPDNVFQGNQNVQPVR